MLRTGFISTLHPSEGLRSEPFGSIWDHAEKTAIAPEVRFSRFHLEPYAAKPLGGDRVSTGTLKIEGRLRQIKGRESRTQSIATRFTQAEEQSLLKAAEARGQNLREWARETLLREVALHGESVSTDAVMTEIVGLQLFLTHVLEPVACGERMSADQYQELMRQVKTNKHQAVREVIAQYCDERKETPDA